MLRIVWVWTGVVRLDVLTKLDRVEFIILSMVGLQMEISICVSL